METNNIIRRWGSVLGRALGVAVILALTAPVLQAAVETKNLFQNGDFEEAGTPPPGWIIKAPAGTSYEFSSKTISGKQALKLTAPVPGSIEVSSEPVPVSGGEDYLFTCWFQSEGQTNREEGYQSGLGLVWLDESGRYAVRRDSTSPGYGLQTDYLPITWTATAPPNAYKVQVSGGLTVSKDYKGPTAVIYLDDVRLMKLSRPSIPADARKWEYPGRMENGGVKIVEDKDAAGGKAAFAELGKVKNGIPLIFGPYTREQPVGEYLATFRLKVKDNTRNEPVADIDVNAMGNLNGQMASKTILATDFKQAGVYQDFSLRFVRPEMGALEFRVFYRGATDLWFDKTTVTQLGAFTTDQEQSAIWLGQ